MLFLHLLDAELIDLIENIEEVALCVDPCPVYGRKDFIEKKHPSQLQHILKRAGPPRPPHDVTDALNMGICSLGRYEFTMIISLHW